MRFLVICVLISLLGMYLFRKTFRQMPKTVKAWFGWIFAIVIIVVWFYLLIRLR